MKKIKKVIDMSEEELMKLIADLVFAYENKDESFPHDFEIEVVVKACDYLLENYTGDLHYDRTFFKSIKNKMLGVE